MSRGSGEMSFLDHLEELRWHIIWSLGALIVGVGLGLWATQQFQLVALLKAPITAYLPDGKLVALRPTDAFLVTLKVGLIAGIVLASPVIIWQVWAFMAPALYAREKKVLIPALMVGLVLFLAGAILAYIFVIPPVLRVLFSFQTDAIAPFITADAYFAFVLQIVLAFGLSFELPLVIIILAWLDVIGPAQLRGFRRYAVVGAFIAGAVLSPGSDLLSMLMMTGPLIVLYEIGVVGAAMIARRRARQAATAAGIVFALCFAPSPAAAQVPQQDSVRADTVRADTARPAVPPPGQALDTATARRMGLPTAPAQSFAAPDSVTRALLDRPGYRATRYRADSAVLYVQEERMQLVGEALAERDGSLIEADTIRYRQGECLLDATGNPHLFDRGQVLVGRGIRYNSCVRRGIVTDALTNFNEGGTVWFLRGNIAQDSSSKRIYAASSEITSCDLPVAHYHFSAGAIKWISKHVLVARPVVLYIADVPVLWLPFMFQDLRTGRRSGILVPQFGLNDLVRPSRSYNRQVTNIGYYWAANEYFDLTARLDWYSNRYVQYGLSGQYRWLNRFLNGNIAWNKQHQTGGGSAMSLSWDHRQQFDLSTNLTFNLNYASNTAIIQGNAIDPLLNTQQITSALNFSKRLDWGTVTLGGNRRQSLTDGTVQQLLPSLTISPVPIQLGSNATWSPNLSFTNNTTTDFPRVPLVRVLPGGILDTVPQTSDSRTTSFNLNTPLRVGSFNWQNSVQMTDQLTEGRDSVRFFVDDRATPDPTDSVAVTRVYTSQFQTGIDWNTGINLPILFRGSWKLQPSVGIANATSRAPFAIRNRNTNGDLVVQGKRFRFGLSAAPTLFAFFPGIGPVSAIRHSFSPAVTYSYAPAAEVSEVFARAIAQPGESVQLRSDPTQTLTVSLSQVFEGKLRAASGDTLGTTARKLRLLSISTSGISYDFEQAKQPGQRGWTTETISNSLLSELLPGFSLNLSHDLWRGGASSDTADFDPFLQSVSANFSLSSRTLCTIGSILRLCRQPGTPPAGVNAAIPSSYVADAGQRRPGAFSGPSQLPLGQQRPFTASVNYTLSRTRPTPADPAPSDRQNVGFSTSFSPTPFWSLSWSSQYNITDARFESQVVRLDRDLHEWKAGFNFVRNANGNFAFYFSVYLTALPDLKFDYDQTTFEQ